MKKSNLSPVERVSPKSEDQIEDSIEASTEGYRFRLHDEVWRLDKDTSLNVSSVAMLFDRQSKLGFLKTLAFYSANFSPSYAKNICDMIANILVTSGKNVLSAEALIGFRASLSLDQEWHAGVARRFLRKWFEFGYDGISEDAIDLLSEWRIRGNKKGEAVKRLDPNQGPLTEIELSAFNDCVVSAYEKGSLKIADAAICLLLSHSGRRPVQLSHLKCEDLIEIHGEGVRHAFIVRFPRAKTKGRFRSEFKKFPITRDLFFLLKLQVSAVKKAVEGVIGRGLSESEAALLPIFPRKSINPTLNSGFLGDILSTDKLHIKTSQITAAVKEVVKSVGLLSERTGEELHVNSRRFRYTFGTRAAREGLGELIIAELLDHRDTQNAGVYIKNIPEHVMRIDEAVGFQLIKYAQAFSGTLVDSESAALRGDDPSSRIRTEEGSPVGTCGEFGFCSASVPVPCYTCIHFQPWRNGPHQEVYDFLIEERERVIFNTGDEQIGAVLDRTILAVAEVIALCTKSVSPAPGRG